MQPHTLTHVYKMFNNSKVVVVVVKLYLYTSMPTIVQVVGLQFSSKPAQAITVVTSFEKVR